MLYDVLLGEYLGLASTPQQPGPELIVATGLAQQPYPRTSYYWRLRNHFDFLQRLGLRNFVVKPRMSRDFLLEFESTQAAQQAAELLSSLRVEPGQQRLFGTVDNRGTSLFCMLTYPHPVDVGHLVTGEEFCTALAPEVALVALKNGMHRSEGSAFLSPGIEALAPAPMSHVSALHRTICSFFGVSPCKAARQAPWAVAVPGSAPGAAAAVPARSRHTLEQATKRAPV